MLLMAIHSQNWQERSFSSETVESQLGEWRLKSPIRMIGSLGRAIEMMCSEGEKEGGELYMAMRENCVSLGRVILRVMWLPLPCVVWVLGLILRLECFQE